VAANATVDKFTGRFPIFHLRKEVAPKVIGVVDVKKEQREARAAHQRAITLRESLLKDKDESRAALDNYSSPHEERWKDPYESMANASYAVF